MDEKNVNPSTGLYPEIQANPPPKNDTEMKVLPTPVQPVILQPVLSAPQQHSQSYQQQTTPTEFHCKSVEDGQPNQPLLGKKREGHCCRNCCICICCCSFCLCCCLLLLAFVTGLVWFLAYSSICGFGDSPDKSKFEDSSFNYSTQLSEFDSVSIMNYFGGVLDIQKSTNPLDTNLTVFVQVTAPQVAHAFVSNQQTHHRNFEYSVSPTIANFNDLIALACTRMNMTVILPYSFNVSTFSFETTNGDIYFGGIEASLVDLSLITVNGNILLSPPLNVENFEATTTNGDIDCSSSDLTHSFTGSSSLETDNGDIKCSNVDLLGNLDVETDNGDVSLSFSTFSGSFSTETDNGDISISGHGIVYKEDDRHEKTGSVGDGSSKLQVSTDNGDIFLGFPDSA